MARLGLAEGLFISHLLVMGIGISTLVFTGDKFVKFYLVQNIEQINNAGVYLRYTRTRLINDFNVSWNRGIFWSVLIGGTAAGGVGYLLTRRITRSLNQMEQITQRFAAGNLEERVPPSSIVEFHRLGQSFNQMAASLADVEQRRRELVSDLSHELRTPLTIIRGYLEELADERVPATPEVYQQLIRETVRLQRLVNDLQELSKAETGNLVIRLQVVQLRPLLESLVTRFADQLLEAGPELKLDCPTPLPPVLADSDRIEQILVNLMGNAVQHTTQGTITLRTWPEAGRLWIAVIDTGEGIAVEHLPHVFERFWRADPARSRHSGGSGIGLAITRRLVELLGGEITVESELGQGSTFRFWLPLADPDPRSRTRRDPA